MKTDVEWRKEFEDRHGKIRDANGTDICREFDEFVRRVQAEANADGMAVGLRCVVTSCRSVAAKLEADARSAADRGDDVMMLTCKAMQRANESIAEITERAERAIRDGLDAAAKAGPLPDPNVPLGNSPTPESK